jgi:hypothetical protein
MTESERVDKMAADVGEIKSDVKVIRAVQMEDHSFLNVLRSEHPECRQTMRLHEKLFWMILPLAAGGGGMGAWTFFNRP